MSATNSNCYFRVICLEAKDVVAKDRGNTSDPYVKIFLTPKDAVSKGTLSSWKSPVIKKTLNPVWSENNEVVFNFENSSDWNNLALNITLWDKDVLSADDFMGQVDPIVLSTLIESPRCFGGDEGRWHQLKSRPGKKNLVSGEIKLVMRYNHPSISSKTSASTSAEKSPAASSSTEPKKSGALASLKQAATVFSIYKDRFSTPLLGLDEYVRGVLAEAEKKGISEEQITMMLAATLQAKLGQACPIPLTSLVGFLAKDEPPRVKDILKAFKVLAPHSLTTAFDIHQVLRDKKNTPVDQRTYPFFLPNVTNLDNGLDKYLASDELSKLIAVPNPPPALDATGTTLPGLFAGTFSPRWDNENALKTNVLFSEIFSRLMFNFAAGMDNDVLQATSKGEADTIFAVILGGKRFVRIDTFLEALVAHASTDNQAEPVLKASIKNQAAIFGVTLSAMLDPKAPPLEVPFTMFMRTGVQSPAHNHEEAVVPLNHCGLFVEFRSKAFSFDIEYYLCAAGNARFRPEIGFRLPWNNPTTVDEFVGDKAIESILTACLYGSITNSYAADEKLTPPGGYGSTGVCSDSVAPIQHVLTGRCTLYPILGLTQNRIDILQKIKQVYLAIEKTVKDQDNAPTNDEKATMVYTKVDYTKLFQLAKAVTCLPNDNALSLRQYIDTIDRIISSIPWKEGKEPFVSTTRARKILEVEKERHRFQMQTIAQGLNISHQELGVPDVGSSK